MSAKRFSDAAFRIFIHLEPFGWTVLIGIANTAIQIRLLLWIPTATIFACIRSKAEWITPRVRVVYVSGGVGRGGEPERIRSEIPRGFGVVVAEVVVVQSRFGVVVLARKA